MELAFLSYSRLDSKFVKKLALDMQANSIPVWQDRKDIAKGSLWDVELEKALKKCDIFILVVSPQSIVSKNVLDELDYALDENKRIIPVRIEKCQMPLRVRRIQNVDFTENYEEALKELVLACRGTSR